MGLFQRKNKFKSLSLRNTARELTLFKNRLAVAITLVVFLALCLIARLYYLQVVQHKYYSTLSAANQINLLPVPPQRGLIYDRNGLLLAKSIPVFSIMVTPDKAVHLKSEIKELNKLIPLSEAETKAFYKQAREHRQFQQVPLKMKLTDEQVAIFAVNRYRFPGFAVQAELMREYPFSGTFSHVIGYVGRINVEELQDLDQANYAQTYYMGKTGIEKYYEDILHGEVGYQRVETDASGEIVRTLGVTPPKAGSDLFLTIDTNLQLAAENALGDAQGAIVAIDPNNGQILAMVSHPTFNPDIFVQGINQQDYEDLTNDPERPLYNRTIRGLYPMGSTIKPFIGLEGLDIGIINPKYQIFDEGWFKIPNYSHIFHDWKKDGHGWVNLRRAIAQSCDTYFYNLAYNMGIKPIDDVLNKFGFGQQTGVDLPGELTGNIPSPAYKLKATGERWYKGDTVNSVIGQGFTQVTPVQLASAAATLAARGVRHQPYLLYAIQNGNKKEIQLPDNSLPPLVLQHEQTWDTIINAMQAVITEGTGRPFGKTPYTVAAKTGTAQVNSVYTPEGEKQATKEEMSNSLFIAFAPVDHPQIAIAVVVEHSPGAAIQVARKVMDTYLITEKHFIPATQTPDTLSTPATTTQTPTH